MDKQILSEHNKDNFMSSTETQEQFLVEHQLLLPSASLAPDGSCTAYVGDDTGGEASRPANQASRHRRHAELARKQPLASPALR